MTILLRLLLLSTVLGAYAQEVEGIPDPAKTPVPAAVAEPPTWAVQREAGRRLAAALAAAVKERSAVFTVPPGDYRFDEGRQAGIQFDQADGLAIEAAGATFWFHGRRNATGLAFDRCRNLRLRGLTLDYDPLPYTQAEVLALDPATRTATVRVDPGHLPLGPEWFRNSGQCKAIFIAPDRTMRRLQMDWIRGAAAQPDGSWLVSFVNGSLFDHEAEVQAGDRLLFPDRSLRHAIALGGCSGMTLEEVTVHASPHMAFSDVGGIGGNRYLRCRVVPRPGRLLACNADVFHVIKQERGPLIEDCEFSFAGDDLVNIHSLYGMVLARPDPRTLEVGMSFSDDLPVGCRVDVVDRRSGIRRGGAQVVTRTEIDDPARTAAFRAQPAALRAKGEQVRDFIGGWFRIVRLGLDRELAAEDLDLVESSASAAAGTVIRGCHFHDGFVRGVVLKGHDLLVEGNRFERLQLAVAVANDRYFWESPASQRVTVRANRISDCARMVHNRLWYNGHNAAITVMAEGAGHAFSPGVVANRRIQVLDNLIERPGGMGIFLANTAEALVAGNRIVAPGALPLPARAQERLRERLHAIVLESNRGVELEGNLVEQPGPACRGELLVGEHCTGITGGP